VDLQQIPGSRGCYSLFQLFLKEFVVSPPWADRHCLLFQLKGKVSALSRGMSGMILNDQLNFYPETSVL
jgi:hypothetical protein